MEPRKPRLVDTTILTAPAIDDAERLIDINYIRDDLGGITPMTIWRWSRGDDPEIRFPPPTLILSGKKRLWFLGVYRDWKARVVQRGRIDTPRDEHAEDELTIDA
jgi:hypothetical protein